MFRKLYWVTEILTDNSADRSSSVRGVYTSIPDLLRHGLALGSGESLRLNLVKLDCEGGPLGVWTPEDADAIGEALAKYVATDEFSADGVASLVGAMRAMAPART